MHTYKTSLTGILQVYPPLTVQSERWTSSGKPPRFP